VMVYHSMMVTVNASHLQKEVNTSNNKLSYCFLFILALKIDKKGIMVMVTSNLSLIIRRIII
jgi:hypothetical protein